eukprot:1158511-Pelagomonas_calceolata.AAC.1
MCLPRWQPLLQGSPGSPERRQCHPRLALQLGGPGCKHAGHGSPMAPVRAHLQAGGCVCEPQHRHGAQPARGAGKGRGGMPIWPGCLEPLFATLCALSFDGRQLALRACSEAPTTAHVWVGPVAALHPVCKGIFTAATRKGPPHMALP